jgi:hypothetical protein
MRPVSTRQPSPLLRTRTAPSSLLRHSIEATTMGARPMRSTRTRTFGAAFLSAWLGFLACLMGCSPSAFGSPRESASCPPPANAVTTVAAHKSAAHKTSAPCCTHHGQSPAPGNRAPQKQSPYCCPMDATFQKQSQTPQFAIHLIAVGLATPLASAPPPAFAPLASDPHRIHSGRDVLLQSRILRV